MELEWERWTAIGDAEAEALVTRIAGQLGAASVDVRQHEYAGRRNRIALFDLDGVQFALVPGGQVQVGYDAARFAATPDQLESYRDSSQGYGLQDSIHEHIAAYTSPSRVADLPALLVAVEAVQAGLTEMPVDEPVILRKVEELRRTVSLTGGVMPAQIEWAGFGRALLSPEGEVRAAWMYDDPTYDEEVTRLASLGRRLLTPDEWEYACGAGATSLFRWGDTYPSGTDPYTASTGPHRQPNLFGLVIGQDPYRDERTADPTVVCGGDGGSMVCGGAGEFVSWLTIATAYRNAEYAEFIQQESEYLDQMLIRPAIPLT
ncbi:MAG TPA: hypothetical protein VL738_38940 [Dactylosporangium sp.]|nr:hypothetical protein [Dactylosporangium sp.]